MPSTVVDELAKPICALPSSMPRTLAMPAPGVCWICRPGTAFSHMFERAAERDPRAALRPGHERHLLRRGRQRERGAECERADADDDFESHRSSLNGFRGGRRAAARFRFLADLSRSSSPG